ncbi:hypothetical protein B0H34DRAFT_692015 [Crassisporium funariophilum]|nr:hypothetical protein B0H34DRAFT_692015 [Crassisporium funariophilum]
MRIDQSFSVLAGCVVSIDEKRILHHTHGNLALFAEKWSILWDEFKSIVKESLAAANTACGGIKGLLKDLIPALQNEPISAATLVTLQLYIEKLERFETGGIGIGDRFLRLRQGVSAFSESLKQAVNNESKCVETKFRETNQNLKKSIYIFFGPVGQIRDRRCRVCAPPSRIQIHGRVRTAFEDAAFCVCDRGRELGRWRFARCLDGLSHGRIGSSGAVCRRWGFACGVLSIRRKQRPVLKRDSMAREEGGSCLHPAMVFLPRAVIRDYRHREPRQPTATRHLCTSRSHRRLIGAWFT